MRYFQRAEDEKNHNYTMIKDRDCSVKLYNNLREIY